MAKFTEDASQGSTQTKPHNAYLIDAALALELDSLPPTEPELRAEVGLIIAATTSKSTQYTTLSSLLEDPTKIGRQDAEHKLNVTQVKNYIIESVHTFIEEAATKANTTPKELGWNKELILEGVCNRETDLARLNNARQIVHGLSRQRRLELISEMIAETDPTNQQRELESGRSTSTDRLAEERATSRRRIDEEGPGR